MRQGAGRRGVVTPPATAQAGRRVRRMVAPAVAGPYATHRPCSQAHAHVRPCHAHSLLLPRHAPLAPSPTPRRGRVNPAPRRRRCLHLGPLQPLPPPPIPVMYPWDLLYRTRGPPRLPAGARPASGRPRGACRRSPRQQPLAWMVASSCAGSGGLRTPACGGWWRCCGRTGGCRWWCGRRWLALGRSRGRVG